MPRKHRPAKRPTGLDDPYMIANALHVGASLLGRRADGEDLAAATALWHRHHNKLLTIWIGGWPGRPKFITSEAEAATASPGTRPSAWWTIVAHQRQPRTAAAELAYLRKHGLLVPGEEGLIAEREAQHARRAETTSGLLTGGGGGGDD